MTQVLFNQFAYTDRLTRGGFTPEQARASAEALETAFSETVATKNDLDRVQTALKADIDHVQTALERVETVLKADIDRVETALGHVETTLKAEIKAQSAATEARLDAKIASTESRLDAKIASTESRLVSEIHSTVYRGGGLLAALIGIVALAARFWK